MGRPQKTGASRHTILIPDAVWRAYQRFGNGDATRGIEQAAVWLPRIELEIKERL